MEKSVEYKKKIDSMQKYVPVLSGVILELQKELEKAAKVNEKIVQLRLLEEQLRNPKPGISLEEMNKCEQALENLLNLQEKKENEENGSTSKKNKQKKERTKSSNNDHLKNCLNTVKNNVLIESLETDLKNRDESSKLNSSKEDSSSGNIKDSFFEIENVEIIEFSESSHDEESAELILPDDENYFVNETIEETRETEENYEWKDEWKIIELAANNTNNDESEKIKYSSQTVTDNSTLIQETVKYENEEHVGDPIDIISQNHSKLSEENQSYLIEKAEKRLKNVEIGNSLAKKQKLSSADTDVEEHNVFPPTMENKKTPDQIEIVIDDKDDVQIIDDQDYTILIESDEEDKTENTTLEIQIKKCKEEDETEKPIMQNPIEKTNEDIKENSIQELQIKNTFDKDRTETPIQEIPLIKSVEEVKTEIPIQESSITTSNEDKIEKSIQEIPMKISNEGDKIDKDVQKNPIKKRNYAAKSTKQNKPGIKDSRVRKSSRIKKTVTYESEDQKTEKNETSSISSSNSIETNKTTTITDNNQKSNFLSNMELKPSKNRKAKPINKKPTQIKTSNPPCFQTNIGKKKILIPNAFYGLLSQKRPEMEIIEKPKVINPPANSAITNDNHCIWLNNFLKHFCSPKSIVQHTSYLLLKGTLPEEDYEIIYNNRISLNQNDEVMSNRIFRQLQDIFYINQYTVPELSYVGRKFCQSAFINKGDKTISLTTDSITNEVTSSTRIVTKASLQAARTELNLTQINQKSIPLCETNQFSIPPNIVIPIIKNNSLIQNNVVVDTKPNPPTSEINNLVADSCPPRVLCTFELSQNSYNETDKVNIIHNETIKKKKKVKTNMKPILTDEIEKFIIKKHEAPNVKRPKLEKSISNQAKSFETAFLETIAFSSNLQVSNLSKDFAVIKQIREQSQTGKESSNVPTKLVKTTKTLRRYRSRKKAIKNGTAAVESVTNSQGDDKFQVSSTDPVAPVSIESCTNIPKPINHQQNNESNCPKDSCGPLTLPTTLQTDSQVVIISDDENNGNDVQEEFLALSDQPTLNVIQKISNVEETINDEPKEETPSTEENSIGVSTGVFEIPSKMIINGRLKNISAKIHSRSIFTEVCLVCNRPVARVVDHYVNLHPNHEVYISRPSPKMLRKLFYEGIGVATYDRLQNGLGLYVATCVFCKKKGSFTLGYWYQHFALHTGEYAYKCTGCGTKKSTRSQISYHVKQNCTRKGQIKTIQHYDTRLLKISAFTCKLCNFTQLNFENMVKHFCNEHDMGRIENFNWAHISLLDITKTAGKARRFQDPKKNVETTQVKTIYVPEVDNKIIEVNEEESPDLDGVNNKQPVVINEAEGDDDEDEDFDVWSSYPTYSENITESDLKFEINE